MAKKSKGITPRRTKSKAAKGRRGKKSIKRAMGKKSRKTGKKAVAKTSRKRVSRSKPAIPPSRRKATPAVETTVIDVVDEPIPGVVRVTEIEETRVISADSDNPVSSRDVPEPDSFGG
jgi:hypothetical protein